MAKRKVSSPVTMEMFEETILPRIEEVFDERMSKHKEEVSEEIKGYREEVVGFKAEVLGEIQDLRDEVTITTHQYERTNKRVDKIAKHLNIST